MIPAGPLTIAPLSRPPTLTWRVPGSKSITNRALVLAALAEGESTLEGALESDDTRHMATGLRALGVEITRALGENGVERWLVRGGRSRLRAPTQEIFVGNSGTTVRFLAALACLVPGEVVLVGDAHMAKRPIGDLVDGLRQLGADIVCETGCPPLRIRGGRLPGGLVRMRGDRSSQYFSALLMAAAYAEGPIALEVEGSLVSRPYVEITRRMITDFGGAMAAVGDGFEVRPATYRSRRYLIEPDASSASYPFALAAAARGRITVPGLGAEALQGDYHFVDVLAQAGAQVERGREETTVSASGPLRGVDVDMHHISDTVMTLAAIAPLLEGPTTIRNVANIRIKETDRLAATVAELERLGQTVESGDDWLRITPGPLVPALVRSYSDHRMAMSFTVLALAAAVPAPGISIEDPACVAKTYPTFWDDLAACRARG